MGVQYVGKYLSCSTSKNQLVLALEKPRPPIINPGKPVILWITNHGKVKVNVDLYSASS